MRNFLFLLLLSFTFSCHCNRDIHQPKYLRWVGDIEYNDKLDNSNFKICNGEENVLQYFSTAEGPVYFGEKSVLLEIFKTKYSPKYDSSQNGLIRIRFIVNCEGKADRFRMIQSNFDYEEFEFNTKITTQLLVITRSIEKWEVLYQDNVPVDYYKYLIFKIKNGQIDQILP
ncbi:hypothetical protein EQG68_11760 [Flavobacterium piscinae]|uniref:TonB C-terminal domain-containing protein n=1 Tax=Flavobacterium piscinae TaxID=2506424 RepID=A0A4Q1KL53_9FLAO|nr:hypothetical protein [Flavobacterium piscinae]RXR30100.1 hypothetical protein EQG68_11760 [Flavobacterium piscinae]